MLAENLRHALGDLSEEDTKIIVRVGEVDYQVASYDDEEDDHGRFVLVAGRKVTSRVRS